jgi:hypothetical protein
METFCRGDVSGGDVLYVRQAVGRSGIWYGNMEIFRL